MIFNIDNQVSFPVVRILDSISKNGDNEVNHSVLVYTNTKAIDEETHTFLKNLVGVSSEFNLSLTKNDEIVWTSSNYAMFENFYVEISADDGRNDEQNVTLKFLYI